LGRGYQIKQGQRIAQLIVQSVVPVRLVEVEALETSERGANGFGSTGR
jgi:dUTP pyrophosphatase